MKIAINGTGVAGPTLAWWLKYFGHEPILFEKSPQLRTGGYMIDFWGVGYDIAERMGILPELQKKGYMMESLNLVDTKGRDVAKLDTKAIKDATNSRFLSISRSDIAATIYHACDNVETHFGTTIIAVEQEKNCVIATLSNGKKEKFDLVIGADGLHSHIRSLLFGPEEKFEKSMGAYVAAFTVSGYPQRNENVYVCYTAPMKQVSRISLRDDKTLFLFTFRSQLIQQMPQSEIDSKSTIKRVFKDMGWETNDILSRMEEAKDFYFDKVSQIRLDKWFEGRVALLGDAAACVSLLGGEGTGLAMTEAYILAGELHQAKGNIHEAFRHYESKLRPFLIQKQKAALKTVLFFAPKNKFDMYLGRFIVRLSNRQFFSNFFIGKTLRDNLELPKYDRNI